MQFHHEAFVVRNGELGHREHGTFLFLSRHAGHIVLRTERKNDLFLHGCTLCHLLVHDFPCDIVHVKRDVALVLDFRMEIQKSVMRIDAFEDILDTETLAADMLHLTLVLSVDGLHDKTHQHRTFIPQFLQVNLHRVVRTVHRFTVVDEVAHLHIEEQRLFRIFDVEGVKAAVLRNDAHVRLVLEISYRSFHSYHILSPVRFSGNKVR